MYVWESMRSIVKERLKTQGVKQKYLAELCGYDEKTFSLIVNGRKPITDSIIKKFCAGMDVTPNELFFADNGIRAG